MCKAATIIPSCSSNISAVQTEDGQVMIGLYVSGKGTYHSVWSKISLCLNTFKLLTVLLLRGESRIYKTHHILVWMVEISFSFLFCASMAYNIYFLALRASQIVFFFTLFSITRRWKCVF